MASTELENIRFEAYELRLRNHSLELQRDEIARQRDIALLGWKRAQFVIQRLMRNLPNGFSKV